MKRAFIAVYKAYRGGEWFGASLESIAHAVQGVVVALSVRPWDEKLTRPENCSGPLEDFRRRHPEIPVFVDTVDFRRHEEHQVHCLQMAARHFGPEVNVLTPDTDEVWGKGNLRRLMNYIQADPGRVYTVAIWDYVRSPYWRIDNAAGASFIAALSSPVPCFPFRTTLRTMGRREDRVHVPGVRFHHFCFVRDDEGEIADKMHLCEMQDGAYNPGWLENVWTKLPQGRNLHPASRHERVWPRVTIIPRSDLPRAAEEVASSRELLDRYAEGVPQS